VPFVVFSAWRRQMDDFTAPRWFPAIAGAVATVIILPDMKRLADLATCG
jgi:hypothetical protein